MLRGFGMAAGCGCKVSGSTDDSWLCEAVPTGWDELHCNDRFGHVHRIRLHHLSLRLCAGQLWVSVALQSQSPLVHLEELNLHIGDIVFM